MKLTKFSLLLMVVLFIISACMLNSPPSIKNPSFKGENLAANLSKNSSENLGENLSGNEQKSPLINFADEANLEQLRANFRKENLHIRIFGDSHMAADFFSSRLRHYIKTGSVGFIYPLQPKYQHTTLVRYKSKNFELLNSKSNDISANFAMGGIIARAQKKGAFVELNTQKVPRHATFIVVFKAPHTKDAFVVKDERGQRFFLKAAKRGVWSFARLKNVDFPVRIEAADKNVLLGGYFIMDAKNPAALDTLGINGAKSSLFTRWNEDTFLQELDLFKSDIVILAYGSNDAIFTPFNEDEFKQNYLNFIKILRKSNPNTSVILISPPTITKKVGEKFELVAEFEMVQKALFDIAKREKLVLFDMHQAMQNSGGKDAWIEQNLSKQDVHLTNEGYKKMADGFYFKLENLLR